MNIFDAVIILVLILSVIEGMRLGLVKGSVSLVGTIIAFIASYYLKNPVASFLYKYAPFFEFDGAQTLNILVYETIAFLLVLILLFAILQIIIKLTNVIEKILDLTVVLGFISKVLGGIVGLIEGYIVTFIILLVLNQPFFYLNVASRSEVANFILNHTLGLTQIVSKTNKVINEVYDITVLYKDDKESFNYNSLDVMMEYDVIKSDTVKVLKEKGKLDFNGLDALISKYGG